MLCVSARLGVVALLGLQRPEQQEQLQRPVRPHLCGGGTIKAPDGGGNGECAASGAYALACVADQIWLPASGMVGSVGVVCARYDETKADEEEGVRVDVIAVGKRKTDGNPHVKVTAEELTILAKAALHLALSSQVMRVPVVALLRPHAPIVKFEQRILFFVR